MRRGYPTAQQVCSAPGTAGGSFAGQRVRQPIRGPGRPRECVFAGDGAEVGIDLAGDVALQAADDFLLGFPFGRAAFGVGAGSRVRAQAGEHDPPQGMAGLAVAARVEPAADGLAGGCRDGGPVRVGYPALPDELVMELVTGSCAYRAPSRLVKAYRASSA